MSYYKQISAISFLYFARSSLNSPQSFQRFRRTLRKNFNWIWQQIFKKLNIAESGQILQWGSMGKIFTNYCFWMKFGTRFRLKPSNDRGEFELDRERSKNNIAKNLFALGQHVHIEQASLSCLLLVLTKCWCKIEVCLSQKTGDKASKQDSLCLV